MEIQPDVAFPSPSFSDFAEAKCATLQFQAGFVGSTAYEQLPKRRHDPLRGRPDSGGIGRDLPPAQDDQPFLGCDLFDEGDRVRCRPGIDGQEGNASGVGTGRRQLPAG
jgi:hypothetical protein